MTMTTSTRGFTLFGEYCTVLKSARNIFPAQFYAFPSSSESLFLQRSARTAIYSSFLVGIVLSLEYTYEVLNHSKPHFKTLSSGNG